MGSVLMMYTTTIRKISSSQKSSTMTNGKSNPRIGTLSRGRSSARWKQHASMSRYNNNMKKSINRERSNSDVASRNNRQFIRRFSAKAVSSSPPSAHATPIQSISEMRGHVHTAIMGDSFERKHSNSFSTGVNSVATQNNEVMSPTSIISPSAMRKFSTVTNPSGLIVSPRLSLVATTAGQILTPHARVVLTQRTTGASSTIDDQRSSASPSRSSAKDDDAEEMNDLEV